MPTTVCWSVYGAFSGQRLLVGPTILRVEMMRQSVMIYKILFYFMVVSTHGGKGD
jgi:hypothetical protein